MFERILVPVDGSATSRQGLEEAVALARLTGGRIRLLHVFDAPVLAIGSEAALLNLDAVHDARLREAQDVLADAATIVRTANVAVEEQLEDREGQRLCDKVAEVALAWRASVIVMGSHGRRGLKRLLLGSDAEQILRTAPSPVLLVRDRDQRAA